MKDYNHSDCNPYPNLTLSLTMDSVQTLKDYQDSMIVESNERFIHRALVMHFAELLSPMDSGGCRAIVCVRGRGVRGARSEGGEE
jgi:hypothetical protein